LCQPVITAIVGFERCGQRNLIHPFDLAYVYRQIHGIEIARLEAATALPQSRQRFAQATPDGTGCGEMGNKQGIQVK
jgi:hypothetical protein